MKYHRGRRLTLLAALATTMLSASAFAVRPYTRADLPIDAGALVLVDRDGAPLGTVLGRDDRHTFAVPIASISPWFVRALIAAEDGRFTRHGALDPLATLRAVAEAATRRDIPSGASTIAMQLARTLERIPPGPAGKIRETLLAMRLENGMSKSEILEAYANRAPMGANVYGVEAAARTYFGTSAARLDLAQSATLAALPNAPALLDPYAHPGALAKRRRYVLARMAELGFIDAETERTAAAENLDFRQASFSLTAPQFCFHVAARTPAGVDRVRTTIDASLQRFVETQMRTVVHELAGNDVHQSAAIVIDNRSAEVRAYAGSIDYSDADQGRNDGVQALRQPGSALKPFLYELAFARRSLRPYTILPDVPTSYAIPGARLYSPTDYSTRFLGPVRPRIALADSLNVPAVRVLERTGVPVFLDRLHALGFGHLDRSPEYYGLGLTLGGGEVSLWELARAYLAMEREGTPVPLVTVAGSPGEAVAAGSPEAASDPLGAHRPEWAEVRDILADPHARAASFGVDSILALPYDAAVKTGTSSDFRDTWTVGFSRDYTVAVWVGNFDGRPMRRITGVTGAGPIWSRIMRHLHERDEPPAFDPPRGWKREAICTTEPRRWHPGCARADEWLDAEDVRELDALARREPHYRLGPEFDAWLALEPPSRRSAEGARILYPRDGDVFVDPAHETQRIVVAIGTRDAAAARLTLDGKPVPRDEDAYVVTLRSGRHALRLDASDGHAQATYDVVSRGPVARVGFAIKAR